MKVFEKYSYLPLAILHNIKLINYNIILYKFMPRLIELSKLDLKLTFIAGIEHTSETSIKFN